MKFLADSVIFIDHLNGITRNALHRAQCRPNCGLGHHPGGGAFRRCAARRREAERLLDLFPTLEISTEVADKAAALRRNQRWKLPDAFQAALAKHHRLRLATRDAKDFSPQRHRFVLIPYLLAR